MTKYKVSYIIVTWNNEGIIEECIDSLYKYSNNYEIEVIVVDNNSQDNTCEKVKQYDRLLLIPLDENLGFSKANNLGLTRATGDFVFYVNPDVIFIEDIITPMIDILDKDDSIGIVSPQLLYKDKSYQISTGNFPNTKKVFWNDLRFSILLSHKKKLKYAQARIKSSENRYVDWAYGAALLVRRDDVLKTGGFPDNLFMYVEDTEFCMLFKNLLNKSTYYLGSCSLIHLGGYSEKQIVNSKKVIYVTEAELRFVEKYYGKKELKKYKQLLMLSSNLKYYLSTVLYTLTKNQKYINRKIKWDTTRKVIREKSIA